MREKTKKCDIFDRYKNQLEDMRENTFMNK